MVAFHHDGTLSMKRTAELVKENAREGGFVMPGFYGATKEGKIRLLDRGGGDISGSILAQCLEADLYENWTDVSGFLSADPRIVPGAQPIPRITYEELRELSYMGASVLHEEAVFPVRDAGIPLVIKNTNAPEDPGTIISETAKEGDSEPIITGIAGKRGFLAINVSRDRTKSRIGFMRRALSVFERYGVSVEHMPTGVDQFAAVVQAADVKDSLYSLISDIQEEVEPLEIEVVENLALIATVGRNLRGRAGISGHLFGKLGEAGVSVRMITQAATRSTSSSASKSAILTAPSRPFTRRSPMRTALLPRPISSRRRARFKQSMRPLVTSCEGGIRHILLRRGTT